MTLWLLCQNDAIKYASGQFIYWSRKLLPQNLSRNVHFKGHNTKQPDIVPSSADTPVKLPVWALWMCTEADVAKDVIYFHFSDMLRMLRMLSGADLGLPASLYFLNFFLKIFR